MKYILGLTSRYARQGICFAILMLFAAPYFNPTEHIAFDVNAETYAAFPEIDLTEGKAPCYTVTIDPTVDGGNARRNALGPSLAAENAEFFTRLESYLIQKFTDETWSRTNNCFEGSFVVNFSVEPDGSLGNTQMLHHQRKGGTRVGTSVFEILEELDRAGHRWHDGTLGKGEIVLPIRFRIG